MKSEVLLYLIYVELKLENFENATITRIIENGKAAVSMQ